MDKNRFWNEFKIVVAHNWRLDAGLSGIVFLATIVTMEVITNAIFSETKPTLTARTENAILLSSMINMVAMAYCSAMVYGDLTDKSGQIRLLMNPSTVAEKFWTRILHTFIVVMILTEVAGDAGALLWMVFQSDETRTFVYERLFEFKDNGITEAMSKSPLFYIASITSLSCYIAACAVGASYFRKHPFLYTALVLAGIFLVVMFVIGVAIGFMIAIYGHDKFIQYAPSIDTGLAILTAFDFILCALLLYWAYRRFAGLQYRNR